MSPFMILFLLGMWKIDPNRWFELPHEDISKLDAITDDDIGGGFFPNAALGGVLWRYVSFMKGRMNGISQLGCTHSDFYSLETFVTTGRF